ncbi:MAG: hypothetical protein MI867_12590 [Pseudomonadales bacterium]|nr:hypothetical protein [Pseudomonadales bacterium]
MTEELHNREAEMAVLGMLLKSNDWYWRMAGFEATHFYFDYNKMLYEHISHGIRNGEPVTAVGLKHVCEDDPTISGYGGVRYLVKCMDISDMYIGISKPANLVSDMYKRRKIMADMSEIYDKLKVPDGITDADEVLADLFSMSIKYSGEGRRAKIRSYQKVTRDILEDMEKELPCYSTGIARLDKAMQGGAHVRKNYCIAARPKNGKTVLLSTVAANMAQAGIPTLYICAEMGEKEIHQRVLARQARVNSMAFINKRKDMQFIDSIVRSAVKQPDNCYYVDAPNITFQELQRVIMLAIKKHKIKGFFLDYLQLVGGKSRHENMVEHQERVAAWLAQVVKENDIFCMYAAQRNREGQTRGGDAILMSVDQLYNLEFNSDDKTAHMTMEATRYTPRVDVGTKESPGLWLNKEGPYFSDIDEVTDEQKNLF